MIDKKTKLQKDECYHDFRKRVWDAELSDTFDYRGSSFKNDVAWPSNVLAVLNPRPQPYYRDTWHCKDPKTAKKIARMLLQAGDIVELDYKFRWVHVKWDDSRKDTGPLPGQAVDDRKTAHG